MLNVSLDFFVIFINIFKPAFVFIMKKIVNDPIECRPFLWVFVPQTFDELVMFFINFIQRRKLLTFHNFAEEVISVIVFNCWFSSTNNVIIKHSECENITLFRILFRSINNFRCQKIIRQRITSQLFFIWNVKTSQAEIGDFRIQVIIKKNA